MTIRGATSELMARVYDELHRLAAAYMRRERCISPRTHSADLVALDEALTRLAQIDARQARVVELRFFGGLTAEETAKTLAVSTKTVNRDWLVAKAWLHAEIAERK